MQWMGLKTMTAPRKHVGWSEEYRGYTIRQGEPQYGRGFAYQFTLTDTDDGRTWFCSSPEECKEEIDERLEG